MTRGTFALLIGASLACLCGCGARSAQDSTVVVGVTGTFADAAIYIAQDRGYFAEQGLTIELQQFASLPEMLPLLATNRLDVGSGAAGAALFNALGRDIDLKIVADNATPTPQGSGAALVVRTDLVPVIRTEADLAGRTIAAIAPLCSTTQLYLDRLLKIAGKPLESVNFLPLGWPDMVIALENRSIELALMVEPFVSLAQNRGVGRVWRTVGDIYPGQESSVLVYTGEFATRRRDIAQRFMVARLKAAREYNEAMFKGINKASVVQILVNNTVVKNAALYDQMQLAGMNPLGTVNIVPLAADQSWFLEHRCITQAVNLTAAIDNRLSLEAGRRLEQRSSPPISPSP